MKKCILNRLDKLNGIERIGFVIAVVYFFVVSFYSLHSTSNRSFDAGVADYIFYYLADVLFSWVLPVFLIRWLYKKLLPWILEGFRR